MDQIAISYPVEEFDENLLICPSLEIMWQKNRSSTIKYHQDYWNKYVNLEHMPIARKLNEFRCTLVEKYCKSVVDIGIGSGEFIKKLRIPSCGYDVNPIAIDWLKKRDIYVDIYKSFPPVDGVTLWDVFEHLPYPRQLLNLIPLNCLVFISVPIINNFNEIYKFKHYRPREHLSYFTKNGIINYFKILEFNVLEDSNTETLIGRENIHTFVFKKC